MRMVGPEDGNLRHKKVREVPISSTFTLSPIAVAFQYRQLLSPLYIRRRS